MNYIEVIYDMPVFKNIRRFIMMSEILFVCLIFTYRVFYFSKYYFVLLFHVDSLDAIYYFILSLWNLLYQYEYIREFAITSLIILTYYIHPLCFFLQYWSSILRYDYNFCYRDWSCRSTNFISRPDSRGNWTNHPPYNAQHIYFNKNL